MGRKIEVNDRLRIIVTGYILRWPLGGNAWPYLQYVLGLSELGHEVYYLEESGDSPYCCYNAESGDNSTDPGYGLRFTAAAFDSVGLGDKWAYYDVHTTSWLGPCAERVNDICTTADMLLRLPAMADSLRPWMEEIPVRALIDIDPVFTQLRHLRDPSASRDAHRYNAFFSFGENIPRGTSSIPDDGLPWVGTRPPIVLDAWPVTPGPEDGRFTTVMKWESYRNIEYDGVHYGMKAESFGPYMDLPRHFENQLELSVGGGKTPVDALKRQGWWLSNPLSVSEDMWTYQRYIQASKAEFSVAKQGYVISHSGWLSDRTGAYLASGRPALVQETGFSDWVQADGGLVAFRTPDEAAAGIEDISSRYRFHCRAAREVAEEFFDARKVLQRLLEQASSQAQADRRQNASQRVSEERVQGMAE
jgi:hypothetical protein